MPKEPKFTDEQKYEIALELIGGMVVGDLGRWLLGIRGMRGMRDRAP